MIAQLGHVVMCTVDASTVTNVSKVPSIYIYIYIYIECGCNTIANFSGCNRNPSIALRFEPFAENGATLCDFWFPPSKRQVCSILSP
jgi:hypothetical protein